MRPCLNSHCTFQKKEPESFPLPCLTHLSPHWSASSEIHGVYCSGTFVLAALFVWTASHQLSSLFCYVAPAVFQDIIKGLPQGKLPQLRPFRRSWCPSVPLVAFPSAHNHRLIYLLSHLTASNLDCSSLGGEFCLDHRSSMLPSISRFSSGC